MRQGKVFIRTLQIVMLGMFFLRAQIPPWEWAKSAGGVNDEFPTRVIPDLTGHLYLFGYFMSPELTFGSTVLKNAGMADIFLAKYDSQGSLLWARSFGSNGIDEGSIAIDKEGNLYMAGDFYGDELTFDSIRVKRISDKNDIFVAKLDAQGRVRWIKTFGGSAAEWGNDIAIDENGYLYVVGNFTSPELSFGSYTLKNRGDMDAFVVRFDPMGHVVWARNVSGSGIDWGWRIAVNGKGYIYVAGWFNSPRLNLGTISLKNAGDLDACLIKYDTSGNLLWAKSLGANRNEGGFDIKTDKQGHVYLMGIYNSPELKAGSYTLKNVGSDDIFIAKYDEHGQVLWVRTIGGPDKESCIQIAVNGEGQVYLAGGFFSKKLTVDFTTLSNAGESDVFIIKYDERGNLHWAQSIGGKGMEGAHCISVDENDNVYLGGEFSSPTLIVGDITLRNVGHKDVFVGKLRGRAR